ncbi:ATPase [Vulcanibacillus modesticaldus]|uniref:ATPase n=1 Tax=Vulcanibacillus modesticaldus TaxID=337097 RepID=A0A1D2YTW8_9BACI|nr:CpaF family protein [Vulcanibacillus modesticaldus]OEF99143.1 ATPase [Vulcanibacillus modesticaldus]
MSVEDLIKKKQREFFNQESTKDQQMTNPTDAKSELYHRVRQRISENRDLFISGLGRELSYVRNNIWKIIEDEMEAHRNEWLLTSYERAEVLEQLMHTMFGYGVLEPLIHDPTVTEIMVNGLDKIYIEKEGIMQIAKNRRGAPLSFNNSDELMHVIEKIVSPLNRKINESDPIVDARLPNGSRVNVVLKPISIDGTSLTIRKFPEEPYSMEQLISFGTLTPDVAELLEKMVKARYNIIISGGTGSGKTTFLNALSMFIPSKSRIITIEDAAELKLSKAENIIRLETRPSNMEGKGEISMRTLVRTALRMRPDRIIVGEVRSGEALDMLQAMNTGHEGSLSTGHANSAIDMLSRLETMVLMSGLELPIQAIRQQIASAIDFIIQLNKMRDGKRKVVEIVEVLGMEENIKIQTIYQWDEESRELRPTGKAIQKTDKFLASGIELPTILLKGGEE